MKNVLKALVIVCISTVSLIIEAQTPAQVAQVPRVGIIAGDVEGVYTRLAQDLAEVSNESNDLDNPESPENARLMVTLGGGSIQNIVDIVDVIGIDLTIVQSDIMEAMRIGVLDVPDYRDNIQYIAKLHKEEIHILSSADIRNIKQLQGKNVSFGAIGSGTSATAPVIFNALDIEVEDKNMSNTEAVAGVRDGTLAAAVFVVGKSADYFTDIPKDDGLHLLPIEINKDFQSAGYLSSEFIDDDYPNLIPKGKVIPTIAVSAVLAVYNWSENSARYNRAAIVTERLFENLSRLQRGNTYHKKWKEVNLDTEVPGWDRSTPAQKQLRKLK